MTSHRIAAMFASLPFLWQQPQLPTPTFRASSHLVQVNVIVRDKSGRAIGDLAREDFSITDGGKLQTISVFSVDSGTTDSGAAASAPASAGEALPPNTFSDATKSPGAPQAGVTIILLDNLNTLSATAAQIFESTPYWLEDHALANAKQHLVEYLKNSDPKNRIAIYGLTDTLHVLCDFTCDRAQLLDVVSKYDPSSRTRRADVQPGRYSIPGMDSSEKSRGFESNINSEVQLVAAQKNGERARLTMAALEAISAHVADIPARKNLLWLTANLPFSGEAIARILNRGNIAAYPVDARGLLPRAPDAIFTGEGEGDDYANGKFSEVPAQSSQPIGIDTMQKMADATGGRAFINSNDLTAAIRRAVDDASTTYTIGFYVDQKSLDDKFHELKVQVRRSGTNLQYAKGYFAFKDAATQSDRSRSFLTAIRSPLQSSAIPLNVRLDRVEEPKPHSLAISASLGIDGVQFSQQGALRSGVIEVYVVEQDKSGNVLHQTPQRLRLNLTEQQYLDYLKSGVRFREIIQPASDAAVVRVLVQDPNTSRIGSVIIPLANVN